MFKEKEPRAYNLLTNSLATKKLSQIYLFIGPSSSLKKELAHHFAASILLGSNYLLEEENAFLKRVKNHQHLDFYFLSGEKESLKTEDVTSLLEHLQKTAIEKGLGRKVFVLDYIENASSKVYNQILKFIEETPGENTYGILLCQNIKKLLPTIVSRCVKVPLVYEPSFDNLEKYIAFGLEEEKAYFLSKLFLTYDFDLAKDINFELAYSTLLKTLDYFTNKLNSLAYYFHQNLINTAKNENIDLKIVVKYYFLHIFYLAKGYYQNNASIEKLYSRLNAKTIDKLYILSSEYLNILKTNTDPKLLLDRLAYDISQ